MTRHQRTLALTALWAFGAGYAAAMAQFIETMGG